MLAFHFLQFVSQISKCWSCIGFILPTYQHYFIPVVNKSLLLLFARLSYFLMVFIYLFIYLFIFLGEGAFVLFFNCSKPVRVVILKESQKLIFFCHHRQFISRETVMFNKNESLCSLNNVIYSSLSTCCGLGILYPS